MTATAIRIDERRSLMERRLRQAAETLRRLRLGSNDRPAQLKAWWPDFVRSTWDAYDPKEKPRTRPAAPSPSEIDEMDATLQLLLPLTEAQRKVAWARALRISWRRLEDQMGYSISTLKSRYREALNAMAAAPAAAPKKEVAHFAYNR